MAENLIFTDKEIAFLRELVKNKVEFIIVGLSAAALQGAPVVTQDIELWFKDLNDPAFIKTNQFTICRNSSTALRGRRRSMLLFFANCREVTQFHIPI